MERLSDLSSIQSYYQEAIPSPLMDDFLQAYEQFKKRRFYTIRSQNRCSAISDPQKITLPKTLKHCLVWPFIGLRSSNAVPKMAMRGQKYHSTLPGE